MKSDNLDGGEYVQTQQTMLLDLNDVNLFNLIEEIPKVGR